jgi:hypothetical protein
MQFSRQDDDSIVFFSTFRNDNELDTTASLVDYYVFHCICRNAVTTDAFSARAYQNHESGADAYSSTALFLHDGING